MATARMSVLLVVALTAGTAEVTLPTGLGRTKGGHVPDKEILRGVLKRIVSVPAKA